MELLDDSVAAAQIKSIITTSLAILEQYRTDLNCG